MAFARGCEPWMPGLAAQLTAPNWNDHRFPSGSQRYGSWRWLTRNWQAERIDIGFVMPRPNLSIPIEHLSSDVRSRYETLGLTFLDAPLTKPDLDLLEQAFALLRVGDDLDGSVHTLVRSIHLLSAQESFDVSHSDPALPYSIFISLPTGERHAELRLAESILHEAMHLQLTLIEAHQTLTMRDSDLGYSPWQKIDRPISGLVHGLYVFRIIDRWLARIDAKALFGAGANNYVARRRSEIFSEIATLGELPSSPALSPFGRELVEYLLSDNQW